MRGIKPRITTLVPALLLAFPSVSMAAWSLDNDSSSLSYVTNKAAAISEVNTFTVLKGGITDAGQATLAIDLSSVDTEIEIRNQRMREIVFETDHYASAIVTLDVSDLNLSAMANGDIVRQSVEAELSLHGLTERVDADVVVVKTSDGGVQVSSSSPILVNAGTFGLADAVEELKEIAGLPSINPNVSVSFSLNYQLMD